MPPTCRTRIAGPIEDAAATVPDGNGAPRNRPFWPDAEWVRQHPGGGLHWTVELRDRIAGLADLYLYAPGPDHDLAALLPAAGHPRNSLPYDGILIVVLNVSIGLPSRDGELADEAERARLIEAVKATVDSMNHAWYATGKAPIPGSAPAAAYEFARCLIHFAPSIAVEQLPAEMAGTLDREPVHYNVLISRAAVPGTRWESEGYAPALGDGSSFLYDIPPGARSRITIQHLASRIDEFHAASPLDLPARIARLREIGTGARAFTEVEAEIGETWDADTRPPEGAAPAEKGKIEAAIRHYREAGIENFAERAARLATVQTHLESFREGTGLKRGWRATRFTLEIDSALSAYEELPVQSYRERIGALGEVQVQCAAYIARTQERARLLNRSRYALIPPVEALEGRARALKGEIALSHGIAAIGPPIETKRAELGVLQAAWALARRSGEVQKDLEAQEESVTLLVEYGGDTGAAQAIEDAFRTYFPSMLGIHRHSGALSREDFIPLVRPIIPMDTDVQAVS